MAEPTNNGKKTVTIHGLEMTINPNVLDDVDNFDLIEEIQDGKPSAIKKLLQQILGDDQYIKVRDHFRATEGHFSSKIGLEIVQATQEATDPKD